MDARATWKQGMAFEGWAGGSGYTLPLDATKDVGGSDEGFRPVELFLVGLAGCTAMDVISILNKKKQDVTGFEVRAHADRTPEHPKVFTHIVLEYVVSGHGIERAAVERAVDLSATKYCPAHAMLGKVVPIETVITIIEE
jgi:putative redox protein